MVRALCALMALVAFSATAEEPKGGSQVVPQPANVDAAQARSPLDFTMKDIDGQDVQLSKYKGKVVLIVNVASKCGLTPQYEQLQKLHEKYHERGLVILAFPANDFRGQEPGSEKEIKEFCTSKYNVQFPLFAKVHVTGTDQCELYKFLTSKEKNGEFGGDIEWNFAKFLVDRDGKVVARFKARMKPDDPALVEALEKALGA